MGGLFSMKPTFTIDQIEILYNILPLSGLLPVMEMVMKEFKTYTKEEQITLAIWTKICEETYLKRIDKN